MVWELIAPTQDNRADGDRAHDLNPNDTTVALKGLAGLRSWVDAMEVRIVSRLADLSQDHVSPRFPGGSRGEGMARSVAASEVALTLNIPERTASRLVDESTHLTVKHRATLEALESGSILPSSLAVPAGFARCTTRKPFPSAGLKPLQSDTLSFGRMTMAWHGCTPTFRRNKLVASTSG